MTPSDSSIDLAIGSTSIFTTIAASVLNALFYLHEDELRISELPSLGKADIAAIRTRVSRRVLRWFVHRALLDPDDTRAIVTSGDVALL